MADFAQAHVDAQGHHSPISWYLLTRHFGQRKRRLVPGMMFVTALAGPVIAVINVKKKRIAHSYPRLSVSGRGCSVDLARQVIRAKLGGGDNDRPRLHRPMRSLERLRRDWFGLNSAFLVLEVVLFQTWI